MSVIVALFMGMIIAAEEIIKDRKILERESFLNLNKSAYLLSKVAMIFILSAIQMFLFVVVGNLIMEVKGMNFSYWLILFSTACFANMLGLNISDGLRSVVAIYVVVPFLLVPQILLAGVIVEFDKLHYQLASHEKVPVSGDLMASRWAYEALAVNQFVNNKYQEDLYEIEMAESNVTYDMQFLVPALVQEIRDARALYTANPSHPELNQLVRMIRSGMESIYLSGPCPWMDRIRPGEFTPSAGEEAIQWLQDYQDRLSRQRKILNYEKDDLIDSLKHAAGGPEQYLRFKRAYHNEKLADLVLNRTELHKIVQRDAKLIRKMEPVYMYPQSRNGRAHFYASLKRVGNLYLSTLTFNLMAVWLMTVVLYFLLQFSVLRKVLECFAEIKRNR